MTIAAAGEPVKDTSRPLSCHKQPPCISRSPSAAAESSRPTAGYWYTYLRDYFSRLRGSGQEQPYQTSVATKEKWHTAYLMSAIPAAGSYGWLPNPAGLPTSPGDTQERRTTPLLGHNRNICHQVRTRWLRQLSLRGNSTRWLRRRAQNELGREHWATFAFAMPRPRSS